MNRHPPDAARAGGERFGTDSSPGLAGSFFQSGAPIELRFGDRFTAVLFRGCAGRKRRGFLRIGNEDRRRRRAIELRWHRHHARHDPEVNENGSK